jgi:hypothetical protein
MLSKDLRVALSRGEGNKAEEQENHDDNDNNNDHPNDDAAIPSSAVLPQQRKKTRDATATSVTPTGQSRIIGRHANQCCNS